jgi:hypothetical protein
MEAAPAQAGTMKPVPHEIVEVRVSELFRRIPWLVGFSVEEDLSVFEVEVEPLPGYDAEPEIREAISEAVLDIASEREGAADVLRGRTFARVLH